MKTWYKSEKKGSCRKYKFCMVWLVFQTVSYTVWNKILTILHPVCTEIHSHWLLLHTPFQSCKTPAFALYNFLYKQCLSYICMKWTFYVYEHKYVRCKSMQMFKKRYVIYHYNRDRHFKNIVNSTRLISFCISHHHLLLFPFSDYGGQLYYDSRCDLVD